jgi:hypothetical protein
MAQIVLNLRTSHLNFILPQQILPFLIHFTRKLTKQATSKGAAKSPLILVNAAVVFLAVALTDF